MSNLNTLLTFLRAEAKKAAFDAAFWKRATIDNGRNTPASREAAAERASLHRKRANALRKALKLALQVEEAK